MADKMREVGAVIGGEGNGGVIDPRVGWVRDPFIGMGLILQPDGRDGPASSASWSPSCRPTHIVKDKYTVPRDRLPQLFEALTRALAGGEGEPPRRPAAGLARPLGARAAEQHRADRPRHRRGAATDRRERIVSGRGSAAEVKSRSGSELSLAETPRVRLRFSAGRSACNSWAPTE